MVVGRVSVVIKVSNAESNLSYTGWTQKTPWFQVVIKSKLTRIFLQNWRLQLH